MNGFKISRKIRRKMIEEKQSLKEILKNPEKLKSLARKLRRKSMKMRKPLDYFFDAFSSELYNAVKRKEKWGEELNEENLRLRITILKNMLREELRRRAIISDQPLTIIYYAGQLAGALFLYYALKEEKENRFK